LTQLEALDKVGTTRLAARINDLRELGHIIHTEPVTKGNKTYARYHLIQEKQHGRL
jgi:hypothetical protein